MPQICADACRVRGSTVPFLTKLKKLTKAIKFTCSAISSEVSFVCNFGTSCALLTKSIITCFACLGFKWVANNSNNLTKNNDIPVNYVCFCKRQGHRVTGETNSALLSFFIQKSCRECLLWLTGLVQKTIFENFLRKCFRLYQVFFQLNHCLF